MKKIFLLIVFTFLVLISTSCKQNKTIVKYQVDGGDLSQTEYVWDLKDDLALPTPTKEDYEFVGWYKESNFSGEKLEVLKKDDYKDKDEITLYAKYEEIVKQALVRYQTNEGILSQTEYVWDLKENLILPIPTKVDYEFVGWYKELDFSGERVETLNKNDYKDKDEIILYAKYEEIVKQALVKYQTNEGILPQTECEWDLKEDLVLPSPTKDDYNFIGWYKEPDFSGEKLDVLSKDDYKDKDEIILYAKYEEIVKQALVKYQVNDGILDETEYEWDLKEDLVLSIPTKEYHEFVGWYKESDFSGQRLETLNKEDYNDKEEIILYAKYELESAKEINKFGYDLNGTTISISIYSNRDNPYSEEYIYEDKELRKLQIEYIESKYNCNIEYILTDLYEQRELTNTIYNEDYAKKFKENNILIHYGELCDTFYVSYKTTFQDLLFYPLNKIDGYEENRYSVLTERYQRYDFLGNTFGLISEEIPFLNMFIYDENIFKNLNLISPQKLYQDGLWTVDKFIEYVLILDKEGYQSTISTDYFVQAIANYKGEYLVDFDNKIINFDDEVNLSYLNKLYELDKRLVSKNVTLSERKSGFINCNLLDQIHNITENDITSSNYSFVPYPYEIINDNNFVSSTYNCYALYNNYNIENNGITYEMLYSIIKDLSSGFETTLKYDKEWLYESCDNEIEKDIIDYYLNTKLLFDGTYAVKRHFQISGTFSPIPNYFQYYIDNIDDYTKENIADLIKFVNRELRILIFLEE